MKSRSRSRSRARSVASEFRQAAKTSILAVFSQLLDVAEYGRGASATRRAAEQQYRLAMAAVRDASEERRAVELAYRGALERHRLASQNRREATELLKIAEKYRKDATINCKLTAEANQELFATSALDLKHLPVDKATDVGGRILTKAHNQQPRSHPASESSLSEDRQPFVVGIFAKFTAEWNRRRVAAELPKGKLADAAVEWRKLSDAEKVEFDRQCRQS